ncbi:hypothetical protein EfmAA94_05760 [Enterococcus faecium]|nr:hypothetical protein HMPREF1369_01458 [Enterococcus faecium ERV99]BDP69403.1 hypothetical protein EfmAA94_05760 [Enterococcus faecium]GIP73974.1 hypothetical protein EFM1_27630 [Enterococcus faecium]GJG91933.1 hypothetical protein EFL1_20730 [Enterococcus faecium]GMR71538.1 hypothetical protein NUITMVRE10_02280 [Enterococcus faecium]
MFGIRDCDKTFVTAFFCTKKKFSPNRKICHKNTYFKYESTITNKLKR